VDKRGKKMDIVVSVKFTVPDNIAEFMGAGNVANALVRETHTAVSEMNGDSVIESFEVTAQTPNGNTIGYGWTEEQRREANDGYPFPNARSNAPEETPQRRSAARSERPGTQTLTRPRPASQGASAARSDTMAPASGGRGRPARLKDHIAGDGQPVVAGTTSPRSIPELIKAKVKVYQIIDGKRHRVVLDPEDGTPVLNSEISGRAAPATEDVQTAPATRESQAERPERQQPSATRKPNFTPRSRGK
jgi:hypothetical protein